MDPKTLLSYDPEMERCRQVREDVYRNFKSPSEALAHLGEISRAKRKEETSSRIKLAKSGATKSRKKSA